MSVSDVTAAPKPTRNLVRALVLVTTVTAVVSSLGAPLVPSVAELYNVNVTTAQWSLTASLLVGAVSTPVVGRFATGRLRRPTILVGLGVVTIGTAMSALAVAQRSRLDLGLEMLIAGRALQGVGMSLLPLAMAIARDALTREHSERTMALLSVAVVAGSGFGYPVTSLVAEVGGLLAAYLLGVVCTVTTLVFAWHSVPDAQASAPMQVDWVGAVLLVVGLFSLLFVVSQCETLEWSTWPAWGLTATGVLTLAGWTARTLRSVNPLVDLRLAARPGLAAPNLVAVVAGLGMYSLLTLAVVLVRADQPHFGLDQSVVVAGLLLVPYSLMSVLGNLAARAVRSEMGPSALLPAGCVTFLGATLSLALFHDRLWQVLLAMALGGVGSGFTFSSLALLMVPHVPVEETGPAMAFNQVLRYLGFAAGSAASPALMEAFGGGDEGFRGALLTTSIVWVAAGVGAAVLDRSRAATC